MEPITRNALQRTIKIKQLAQRCSIRIHCKRKRLADPDNLSAKAVIDGIREAGIFEDDNAKNIKEVSFEEQEKCKTDAEEETIIEIWV